MLGHAAEPLDSRWLGPNAPGSVSTSAGVGHDLDRDVYCVLGMPIDCVDMRQAARQILSAALSESRRPFLFSTPNVNFLAQGLRDDRLRRSLRESALCLADGAPIVWIGRLLGVPFKERVAGSDLFEALAKLATARLNVLFVGGPDGAGAAARHAINMQRGPLRCVGAFNPGHGTVEALSSAALVADINASGADILVLALGASKGQAWLLHNHDRIKIPVRVHLGAVVNFAAGRLRRAPPIFRRFGLEWAWRIREEPYLWRRYWDDGWVLFCLLMARVIPLLFFSIVFRLSRLSAIPFQSHVFIDSNAIEVSFRGCAIRENVDHAKALFRAALTTSESTLPIRVSLRHTRHIDARFLGLLIVARKVALSQGRTFIISGASPHIRRLFRLNEASYLVA